MVAKLKADLAARNRCRCPLPSHLFRFWLHYLAALLASAPTSIPSSCAYVCGDIPGFATYIALHMARLGRRSRTFTGCWTCRKRKVLCDESKPECVACQSQGLRCDGYASKLIWLNDNSLQGSKSNGRRFLDCDQTWKGWDPIPDDHVDYLITQRNSSNSPVNNRTLTSRVVQSPFIVFAATPSAPPQSEERRTAFSPLRTALQDLPDFERTDRFLLHHYVNHVAVIMMPYEHSRNPWRTHYPAVAYKMLSSGQRALHDAMLAHAAFNLSVLRGDEQQMSSIGSRHYAKAIQQLLPSLDRSQEASITMATIMTLMMAEVS